MIGGILIFGGTLVGKTGRELSSESTVFFSDLVEFLNCFLLIDYGSSSEGFVFCVFLPLGWFTSLVMVFSEIMDAELPGLFPCGDISMRDCSWLLWSD